VEPKTENDAAAKIALTAFKDSLLLQRRSGNNKKVS
jgi:hypothetical protein